MYEELNRFKSETLNSGRITKQAIDEMVEKIVLKKKHFEAKQTDLDIEISQLIGFNLGGLTTAVLSTLHIN